MPYIRYTCNLCNSSINSRINSYSKCHCITCTTICCWSYSNNCNHWRSSCIYCNKWSNISCSTCCQTNWSSCIWPVINSSSDSTNKCNCSCCCSIAFCLVTYHIHIRNWFHDSNKSKSSTWTTINVRCNSISCCLSSSSCVNQGIHYCSLIGARCASIYTTCNNWGWPAINCSGWGARWSYHYHITWTTCYSLVGYWRRSANSYGER